MLLTNLGFLFLLLPVSAAAYCFVPSRKKPLALLLLSAFFLLLIDRYTPVSYTHLRRVLIKTLSDAPSSAARQNAAPTPASLIAMAEPLAA